MVRTCESGNCWEQHSGSHQGSSSRLDEFDRKDQNQMRNRAINSAEPTPLSQTSAITKPMRTVEDEGIVEITRHLTSRCKSAPDPILKFEAIDQAENLSAFADLFNSLRAITALSSLLCRITFSMGWAAWDAKIVSICKSSAVWSIPHC